MLFQLFSLTLTLSHAEEDSVSIVRHVSDIGGWKQDTLVAFGPLNTGSASMVLVFFLN